jgi:hypothetical protein
LNKQRATFGCSALVQQRLPYETHTHMIFLLLWQNELTTNTISFNRKMAEATETKSLLTKQAERMREELVKAADKVKEIPAVKKALDMYDEQMEKLRQAMVSVSRGSKQINSEGSPRLTVLHRIPMRLRRFLIC